jgi:5-methyltetrahydrofolate--homocysteine methyltransferase
MNPVALPVSAKKIAEKRAEVLAAGVILPDGMDDAAFVALFGMGATTSRPGKEMEAIRAANLLFDQDAHGSDWIQFNKADTASEPRRRGGGRRRRA